MRRFLYRGLLLGLLLAYFAQGMCHARHASITFDEGPHLAIGYTTLRTGDFRLQPVHIHPPLANVLAAAPLLLQHDLPDPRAVDGWEIASLSAVTDAVVWQYPHPARLATAGRIPILWLGVLLGALVARWARDIGGRRAGLFALALYAFDPNLIAHGSLITTDMAATCLSVALLYVLYRAVTLRRRRPVWLLVGAGALLGLAQLAKVSTLLLAPVVALILLVDVWRSPTGQHRIRDTLQTWLLVFLPAALVVWAGYGFEIGQVSGMPLPLPAATHVRIFQSLQQHYSLGHPTFLMGRVSEQGWWWYFPVAFALKTPLPALILMLWAGLCATFYIIRNPSNIKRQTSKWLTVGLFPLLYAGSALFSTVNIGYRHLLPLLPFLYIALGWAAGQLYLLNNPRKLGPVSFGPSAQNLRRPCPSTHFHVSRLVYSVLLFWQIAGALLVSPHYLAFFNALAGGPEGGYRYLVDSNLDWGQNLWDLRDWMAAQGESHVYYAHYSPARPQVYGLDVDFLPPDPRAVDFTPWAPAPGLYAIGATVLQGPYAPQLNTYAWFRSREPAARLGHALFLYRITAEDAPPPAWAAICADPAPVIPPETVRANLGQPELRVVLMDCARGWPYPADAQTIGLYYLPPTAAPPPGSMPVLQLRTPEGATALQAFRVGGTAFLVAELGKPISGDGPLTFLGSRVLPARPGETVEFWAYWRVERNPDRLLSLMGHLVGPDGTVVAVDDGLGVPLEYWQQGDILVQRHRLPLPAGAPPGTYALRTGGYWLEPLQPWRVDTGDGQTILVGELTVEK